MGSNSESKKLAQVFFNIIGNALKFTDRGAVEVSTGVKSWSNGDRYAIVEVTDTGKGRGERPQAERSC